MDMILTFSDMFTWKLLIVQIYDMQHFFLSLMLAFLQLNLRQIVFKYRKD